MYPLLTQDVTDSGRRMESIVLIVAVRGNPRENYHHIMVHSRFPKTSNLMRFRALNFRKKGLDR